MKKLLNIFTSGPKVAPPETRPHGSREESAISSMADQEARAILMRAYDGPFLWEAEHLDLGGIVLYGDERAVRKMLGERVFARIRHHAKAELNKIGSIRIEGACADIVRGDANLSAARLAAVEETRSRMSEVAEILMGKLLSRSESGQAMTFDPEGFDPERHVPWPKEGWDRESLGAARAILAEILATKLEESGHKVSVNRGVITAHRDVEENVLSAR